jgi:hypothetical protein
MRKRIGWWGIIALALVLVTASAVVTAAGDDERILTARLTGAAEVPGPGDPDGAGRAWVILLPRQGQVCFTLTVEGIDPLTAGHIHVGRRDVAGPVVVPLTPLPAIGSAAGGCVSADRKLIRAIRENPSNYYVNVHNAPFPSGALRGQLHPLDD